MHILIAGASGFIGKALVQALQPTHTLTLLGRNQGKLDKTFPSNTTNITWNNLSTIDASKIDVIINLSGLNIAAKRWSPAVKQLLISSRVNTNQMLTEWLIKARAKPHFICANAVGIHGGHLGDETITFDEASAINREKPIDFLSEICIQWQNSLDQAKANGIPVTFTHFGVVLKKHEGMLKKLEPSFYMGLGSIVGDGQQIISWIHLDDLIQAMIMIINDPTIVDRINLTSPQPVTQKTFAEALAHAMHRPLFLKMPASVINLLFGEMGEKLLLQGQCVLPKRLTEFGFKFKYPSIQAALQIEYSA